MARQVLPVNFQDDVLNASMNGKRRYMLLQQDDGSYILNDVTNYDTEGSAFGAAQINATNQAVNQSVDKDDVLNTSEEVEANVDEKKVTGALVTKQLISEINSIGKLLWSGSFTSGSITVPGLSNYSYVIVNVGGVSCFGSHEYGGNVISGYASYGFAYRSYRFSVNGDKLTIDDINKGGSDGTGNVEVRNIIGLIPKISA